MRHLLYGRDLLLLAVAGVCLSHPRPTALEPGSRPGGEECTIGVACGSATPDGRPLLWKTRDNGRYLDNEIYYNTSLPNRFIAVVNANGGPASEAWMGVNEHGFAILNALSSDLSAKEVRTNGEFIRDALGTCRSAAEFVALLDSTNSTRDTRANFGVIDSTGAAFIFEASPGTYWTYDAREAPEGFIVRANFACNDTAGTGIAGRAGAHRFTRSMSLVSALVADSSLTCGDLFRTQMRDFADSEGAPLPVPCHDCGSPDSLYGFIDSYWSICRQSSVSAAVIGGVTPDPSAREPAYLSTLWVLLGHPASTVAVPYWPVGPAPAAADGDSTAPLCDRALQVRHEILREPTNPHLVDSFRLLDGNGSGFWAELLPAEELILASAWTRLEAWRAAPPGWEAMLAYEDSLAESALSTLRHLSPVPDGGNPPAAPGVFLSQNRPNPFNPSTLIAFDLRERARMSLAIHDVSGRLVRTLLAGEIVAAGPHEVRWDGRDAAGRDVSSGTYFCRLASGGSSETMKMALIR